MPLLKDSYSSFDKSSTSFPSFSSLSIIAAASSDRPISHGTKTLQLLKTASTAAKASSLSVFFINSCMHRLRRLPFSISSTDTESEASKLLKQTTFLSSVCLTLKLILSPLFTPKF